MPVSRRAWRNAAASLHGRGTSNEHLRFDDDADEAERRTFLLGDIVQSLGCLSTPELELVAEIANFLTEADVEELETSERGAREADKAATSEGDSAGEVDEEELAAAAAERDSNSPWRLSGPPAANGDGELDQWART